MPATTIAVSAGNEQVGLFSAALPTALAVLVTDASGDPVASQAVAWAVGAGGGSLSAASSSTNAAGIASITWTLGDDIGPQVVTAVVNGLTGSPVVFTATAAVITVAKVKKWLRLEVDQTDEDDLIADFIVRAQGAIEAVCGIPLTKRTVTFRDDAQSLRFGGANNQQVTNLLLGFTPIDESTFAIINGEGETVDALGYEVRQDLGMVSARGMGSAALNAGDEPLVFDNGPYVMTCTAGFGCASNYATVLLPFIQQTVIEYCAYLYQQRTPGASSERAAGTSVDYTVDEATGLPKIIARACRKFRGMVYGI